MIADGRSIPGSGYTRLTGERAAEEGRGGGAGLHWAGRDGALEPVAGTLARADGLRRRGVVPGGAGVKGGHVIPLNSLLARGENRGGCRLFSPSRGLETATESNRHG